MKEIPIMPKEYKGIITTSGGYTSTQPRKWTKEELDWCKKMRDNGFSSKDIAKSVGRSQVSVSIKLKRLSKKDITYNKQHIEEKYKYNQKFVDIIKPNSILDVYAGNGSFYDGAISNDINESFDTHYHLDAQKLLCKLFYDGYKYDLIDLDPFGSAYDCFHLAIQIAQKGLVITIGEMGHKRWKRLAFVRTHYGIDKIEDFTTENIIKEIQRIGLIYKKTLIPVFIGEWNRISRVYFKIEQYKITEQWD